jgi:hypothetical protein
VECHVRHVEGQKAHLTDAGVTVDLETFVTLLLFYEYIRANSGTDLGCFVNIGDYVY